MTRRFLELAPDEPDPPVDCHRGIALPPAAERRQHGPDRTLLLVEDGSLAARCSCWWSGTAMHRDERTGIIGHYAAEDAGVGAALLAQACAMLAANGATLAVGPIDGTTWRRYRLVVERGPEPPFLLEPDNPDDWPAHWTAAGFSTLATYTSALNDDLSRRDARTDAARDRLSEAGIAIRPLDPSTIDAELARIFHLSLASFRGNFLYTPVGRQEFIAQYQAVLPSVRPELVLLAERGDALLGFVFALPDLLQARRGVAVDTVVVKTVAVDPSAAGLGLGGVLVDLVQQAARELGYRRAIHALMHETNLSRRISDRFGRTIRRYALFSRPLTP
jgi:L-amino acid N-acyltransferase YncA